MQICMKKHGYDKNNPEVGYMDPYTVELVYLHYSGREAQIKYEKEYTNKVDTGVISRSEFISRGPFSTMYNGRLYNGSGYGLVGFTLNKMKAMLYDNAKSQNKSIGDYDVQCDTILEWIKKDNFKLYNDLMTSTDIDYLTNEFVRKYERPVNMSERVVIRTKFAKMYYEKIKNNSLSGGTASSNEIANKVIKLAESKLGCKYVWGAKGPNTFDCSGLVYWCYKQVGIDIPSYTGAYMPSYSKYKVNLKDIQPGDVLWRDDGSGNGHAGLYIGNDTFIHAPQTGDVVKKSSVSKYGKFMAGFRFWNK